MKMTPMIAVPPSKHTDDGIYISDHAVLCVKVGARGAAAEL